MHWCRRGAYFASACGVALVAQQRLASCASAPAQSTASACTMVDAGSGWTRIERFSRRDQDGLIQLDGTKRLPPLADVLIAGGNEPERWLQSLAAALDASEEGVGSQRDGDELVYIGATAGLRSALADGALTEATLADFKALVHDTLGKNARFAVVSGEDEAALELRAVEYCVRASGAIQRDSAKSEHGQSIDLRIHSGQNQDADYGAGDCALGLTRLGLISSGGMSSQLVFPLENRDGNSGGVRALSLPTALKKEGNRRCLQDGVERGLTAYGSYLDRVVASASVATAAGSTADSGTGLGQLRGTFICIEMLGAAGERVGIGRQVLSVRAATEALDAYIVRWLKTAERDTAEEVAKRTWKSVVPATSALQARRLLELLHPDAQLYFSRTFELVPGLVLKPSWTLGYALRQIIDMDSNEGEIRQNPPRNTKLM